MFRNLQLLLLAGLIAGTSWICVPSQILTISYTLSIGYRFVLAGSAMLAFCYLTKKTEKVRPIHHLYLFLQGMCMYCISHWFNYNATSYIPTGVVALVLASTIIPNTILGKIFLKDQITRQFLIGAFITLIGIGFIFWNDLIKVRADIDTVIGFSLVITSIIFTSTGTLISKKMLQEKKYPLLYTNGLAILYGGLISLSKQTVTGGTFEFDLSLQYILPLLYLSFVITPLVFGIYLKLASEVSAAYASYIWLIMPVVALILSNLYEGFLWTFYSITGTILAITGGFISSQKGIFKINGLRSQ